MKQLLGKLKGNSQVNFIVHKLQQLAATAGGADAYSNKNDASEHKTRIGSAFVRYKVFQSTGDTRFPGGVYIIELETANFIDGVPGLYRVTQQKGVWALDEDKPKKINTKYAAVNGLCESRDQAARMILPEMLEKAYDSHSWGQNTLAQDGFTMSYNPPSLYANGKHWKTPKQKTWNKALAAKQLSSNLIDAQNRGHEVLWAVHGSGAELMHDAIKATGDRKLDKHTMMFLSPKKKMSEIVSVMKASNITLHRDVMQINADDFMSKKVQIPDAIALKAELETMPGFKDKATELREEALADASGVAGLGASALGLGFGIGAFILAPAAPAITAGAMVSTALGAYGTWDKLRSLRNIAANHSTDSRINPHMHPYKNNVQMNMHARQSTGGTFKSFAAGLKALLRI